MQLSAPFARAVAMMAAIAAAMRMPIGGTREAALNAVGEYKSRGKGGRKSKPSRWFYANSRSKYAPHQGKREIARRARQIERGQLRVS